jgi:hypothetical protein
LRKICKYNDLAIERGWVVVIGHYWWGREHSRIEYHVKGLLTIGSYELNKNCMGMFFIIILGSNGHGRRVDIVELTETIKSCRGKCRAIEHEMKGW